MERYFKQHSRLSHLFNTRQNSNFVEKLLTHFNNQLQALREGYSDAHKNLGFLIVLLGDLIADNCNIKDLLASLALFASSSMDTFLLIVGNHDQNLINSNSYLTHLFHYHVFLRYLDSDNNQRFFLLRHQGKGDMYGVKFSDNATNVSPVRIVHDHDHSLKSESTHSQKTSDKFKFCVSITMTELQLITFFEIVQYFAEKER
ncbi:MAG: hypothetical protein QXF76_00055 [Candidatus Anstonellales archaeon]